MQRGDSRLWAVCGGAAPQRWRREKDPKIQRTGAKRRRSKRRHESVDRSSRPVSTPPTARIVSTTRQRGLSSHSSPVTADRQIGRSAHQWQGRQGVENSAVGVRSTLSRLRGQHQAGSPPRRMGFPLRHRLIMPCLHRPCRPPSWKGAATFFPF